MDAIRNCWRKLIADQCGATAIEYGLIAALISVVIIASVTSAGESLKTIFGVIATKLADAAVLAGK